MAKRNFDFYFIIQIDIPKTFFLYPPFLIKFSLHFTIMELNLIILNNKEDPK